MQKKNASSAWESWTGILVFSAGSSNSSPIAQA
jgi:hypothetical protein